MRTIDTDVAVIGAGSVGIAVAYFLKQLKPALRVALIDQAQPMSLTSAASGENYRNWWPHPVMKQFMDRSIELFSELNEHAGHNVVVSRSGYLLATRDSNPSDLLDNLRQTFGHHDLRDHSDSASYERALATETDGVDIIQSSSLISQCYEQFDPELQTLVHIRKGGSISTHEIGNLMLAQFRESGGTQHTATVHAIERDQRFAILIGGAEPLTVNSGILVNAAGPFSQHVSQMLDVTLPIENTLQQKIAFADREAAVQRQLPFTIDLDPQLIEWSDDERAALASDPELARFANTMPGSIHCRPDGGIHSNRIKLGWAYNDKPSAPARDPVLDNHFPEIVLRGASRLQPALKTYLRGFPRDFSHYGGFYTLTRENWPLIGATALPDYFVATAMSGFGSMAACAAGELLAQSILGTEVPGYASDLSLQRYANQPLMDELGRLQSRGIL